MSEKIGATAGLVWQCLKGSGPATATQIQKKIGADAAETHQALGWLAREGKLRIDRSKKASQYELTE